MRRRFTLSIAVTAILAAGVYWALAQTAARPLATLFPPGALLYLEAKNFGTLISDWNASAEKKTWLGGSNEQVFSRSHLYLRLNQAQTEFATAAGVPPDYALLSSVAGTDSALAIYNIGKLEFLYITRLASTRAMDTALWKARGTYQTRNAAGTDYYVKEDPASHRSVAFAYAGDLLILATREDLITGALPLLAQQNQPSLASERWFANTLQAAAPGANDLRLVYNMERLAPTPQFRSYWVQRNAADLRVFASGLADLERVSGEMRERRVLLRTTPAADLTSAESGPAQLLALVPDEASLYKAWANPSAEQAERWISEKLFPASSSAGAADLHAPGVSETGQAGTEFDLETKIDQAPLIDDRSGQAFQALRARLAPMKLEAMLELGNTRLDASQVFVRPQAALVLQAASPWDANGVREALTSAVGSLWSNGNLGAGWRAGANGVQELDGLGRIAFAIDARRLILSDSPALVAAILARRTRPAVPGAVYAAGWRHARELPNFDRMMRLIDFPQIRTVPAEGEDAAAREPLFYSENMASLGRSLRRVQDAAILVHDNGSLLRESIVYRIGP